MKKILRYFRSTRARLQKIYNYQLKKHNGSVDGAIASIAIQLKESSGVWSSLAWGFIRDDNKFCNVSHGERRFKIKL